MRFETKKESLFEAGIRKYCELGGDSAASSLRSNLRSIAIASHFKLLVASDLLQSSSKPAPKDFESRLVSLFI